MKRNGEKAQEFLRVNMNPFYRKKIRKDFFFTF